MTARGNRAKLVLATVVLAFALVGAGFVASRIFNFNGTSGSLSSYSVGFYDLTPGFELPTGARLYLLNPTPLSLVAYVVMFDDAEHVLGCTKQSLSANDLAVVSVGTYVSTANNPSLQGVIKIVTFDAAAPGVRVQAGIKAWIRHEAFQIQTVIVPPPPPPVNNTSNQSVNQTVPGPVNQTVRISQPLTESGFKEVPEEVLFYPGRPKRHRGHTAATELQLLVNACP